MSLKQQFCFSDNRGEDIYLFMLSNAKETEVSVSNYGAIITAFKIKTPDGSVNDIVLGFDTAEDYISPAYLKNYAYLGAACGRYTNRIKNGRFILNGKEYQLSQNMGADQLHGGHAGFDKKTWQLVSASDSALELKYLSPDGEEGFPGNLETKIRFELNDNNELTYEFFATTDKPTAVNHTHHSYFNLNNGKGTIEEHEVRIPASHILIQDKGLVCNGEILLVENTKYDFRNFRKINQVWDKMNGYDQCFIIDVADGGLKLVAEAKSAQSGIRLQLFSTEPAVQFYTAGGMHKLKGKNATEYGQFSGFCIETHKHPNAVNIPYFPNTILNPGEKYYQKNVYRITHEAK